MMSNRIGTTALVSLLMAGLSLAQNAAGAQGASGAQPIPQKALALTPAPAPNDTLAVKTNVGSFKILPKGDLHPSGRLQFSFTGTVLISGADPNTYIHTTGNVRREYYNAKHGKQAYFGSGQMLIVGKFQSVQWFGRKLDFNFKGSGVVRIIPEFDENLETGQFWFDPAKKLNLQNYMNEIVVPSPDLNRPKAIPRSAFEKKKSGGTR